LLARTADGGILLIDPAAPSVAGPVSCPFSPEGLIYNWHTRTVYGYSSINPNLCVIGPDFTTATTVQLAANISSARLLDTGGQSGMLLLSTWDNVSAYNTDALDLATLRSVPVPSLNGASVLPLAAESARLVRHSKS